jgi:septum formation protein
LKPETIIYLASASPRRQELLRQIGIPFEVVPSNLVEVRHPHESPEAYVGRAAQDKARHVTRLIRDRGWSARPVLGADTEVVLDGEILGKPRDRAHGLDLLRRLSGRSHEVLTGVCLNHEEVEHARLSRSRVTFGLLTEEEIAHYWESGEPRDKAGGYAIQGRAAVFVAHIEGSYSGIVGLPLYELRQLLVGVGMKIL